MPSSYGVVLDANVLIPMALCDTLMHAGVEGLYRPLWTAQILEEVQRNLVAKGFATAESAQRRILKEKVIRKQAAGLKRLPNPAISPVENVLVSLFEVAPSFATAMKQQMLTPPHPPE